MVRRAYNSSEMSAAPTPMPHVGSKRVVCVSWIESLARTRELLLQEAGCDVMSIVGREYAEKLDEFKQADLLVLAHSVPPAEKQRIIQLFRSKKRAPVLSLLQPHQTKLPDADFGVEAMRPADFMRAVREILAI